MSEINDIEELPEGIFLLIKSDKIYKRQEPSIKSKYKYGTYHKSYLRGGSNIYLKLIMFKDNIVIP